MALVVDLRLDTPSCGAVKKLHSGQRLRCLGLGGLFGAYGLSEGPPSANVETLPEDPRGLGSVHGADCTHCPMKALPPGAKPLAAEVGHDGLRMQIMVDDDAVIVDALRSLRDQGQGPRRVHPRAAAVASGFTIPWDVLTRRQREALEIAAAMGYFEKGGADVAAIADRLGVSRSTAHEHLQKGLGRLLQAMYA